jgi:hypothetical protein
MALGLLATAGMNRGAAAQGEIFTPDSLFVALFANGDALVEYDVLIKDPSAASITVKLFGTNINDLIVTDYEDKILDFKAGSKPGEIVISPGNATGARISYTTPDLVGKDKNVWTFSINSPISFSVKMPPDSLIIDWGDATPSLIPVGNQTLATFKAGTKTVSYVIGFLGTEEQANINIKLAETSIRQANISYPDIVLLQAKSLLDKANAAKTAGKFADAEKLAAQANDQVRTTLGEYQSSKAAINDSSGKIDTAAAQGRDVKSANGLLDQSRQAFAKGDYTSASTLAGQAVDAIGSAPQFPVAYAGIGAGMAIAGVVGFMMLRRKKVPAQNSTYQEPAPRVPDARQDPGPLHLDSQPVRDVPPSPPAAPSVDAVPKMPPMEGVPESQTDTSLLVRIVYRIFEEKPHLRQEDKDVLQYLAEKEGAAFESELRGRFQLPKTTVWRLVKRLEREELVEIRKAGGQNLIKLRFEGRQP